MPPGKYKKSVASDPDGCYISCDLKCYEPQFKNVLVQEKFEPETTIISNIQKANSDTMAPAEYKTRDTKTGATQ